MATLLSTLQPRLKATSHIHIHIHTQIHISIVYDAPVHPSQAGQSSNVSPGRASQEIPYCHEFLFNCFSILNPKPSTLNRAFARQGSGAMLHYSSGRTSASIVAPHPVAAVPLRRSRHSPLRVPGESGFKNC